MVASGGGGCHLHKRPSIWVVEEAATSFPNQIMEVNPPRFRFQMVEAGFPDGEGGPPPSGFLVVGGKPHPVADPH